MGFCVLRGDVSFLQGGKRRFFKINSSAGNKAALLQGRLPAAWYNKRVIYPWWTGGFFLPKGGFMEIEVKNRKLLFPEVS